MQQEILEQHEQAPLRVYAVWFNMLEGDDRSYFKPEVLSDSRVTHLWDAQRVVGGWFAENCELQACKGETAWDAFFVLGPDAKWEDGPGPFVDSGSGRTIFGEREKLREAIEPLLD